MIPLSVTPEEWQAIWLSLYASLLSVALTLPLAIAMAFLIRKRFPGRSLLDSLLHLPLVLPPIVIGYLLLLIFGVRGPIGSLLYDWFGIKFAFTTKAVILATMVMIFPLLVRSARIALDSVDYRLLEAARTLGARPIDRFFSIALPLMMPGISAGAITAFAAGLGEFGAVISFAANIPGKTETLPLAIYAAMQSPDGSETAARLSTISFFLSILGLGCAEYIGRLSWRKRDPRSEAR